VIGQLKLLVSGGGSLARHLVNRKLCGYRDIGKEQKRPKLRLKRRHPTGITHIIRTATLPGTEIRIC